MAHLLQEPPDTQIREALPLVPIFHLLLPGPCSESWGRREELEGCWSWKPPSLNCYCVWGWCSASKILWKQPLCQPGLHSAKMVWRLTFKPQLQRLYLPHGQAREPWSRQPGRPRCRLVCSQLPKDMTTSNNEPLALPGSERASRSLPLPWASLSSILHLLMAFLQLTHPVLPLTLSLSYKSAPLSPLF